MGTQLMAGRLTEILYDVALPDRKNVSGLKNKLVIVMLFPCQASPMYASIRSEIIRYWLLAAGLIK